MFLVVWVSNFWWFCKTKHIFLKGTHIYGNKPWGAFVAQHSI